MTARSDNAELFAALSRARRSRSAARIRAAASAIVIANHGLVFSHVKRWRNRGVDEDDLSQVGMLGLMRAIESFEPERGFAFSTYATHWIHHFIRREIQNSAATVRTPVHRQAKRHARGEHERAVVVSLDVPIDTDEGAATRLDALADDAPLPDAQATDQERAHAVLRLLSTLPDGERAIVVARYWREQTLAECGPSYRGGVSRERIRQVERIALDRMRSQIASEL